MILDSLFRNASVESPTRPLTDGSLSELFGPTSGHAGVAVNEETAHTMPAVYRSLTLLAGTLASLPLHPYRENENGGRKRITTGQAAALLDSPHPDMTPFELVETAGSHAIGWGNAYLWQGRDKRAQLKELWPLHPSRVKVGRTSSMGRKVYAWTNDYGEVVPFTDNEILHIPAYGYDGICGVSPLRLAREGIGLALGAEEAGAKLFGNGILATGVLQSEQRLEQEDADRLMARWQAKRAGLRNAQGVIVLDGGLQFEQLTIPPADAQFLESRSFQVVEIARMFGIPPHMLGETANSTSWGSGLEQQTLGFLIYTLRPWITRFEQRFTRLLRPEPVYARFAVEGLLRGDSTARAAWYKAMWELGVFSTNEIRELEERERVDGGDVRYRPLNMGVLGEANDASTAEPAPGGDAPPAPAEPVPAGAPERIRP